ncbi:MAG: hypothetical protein ACI841_005433 [Planctomycetota bacterium]|jgi:hypothetical protein
MEGTANRQATHENHSKLLFLLEGGWKDAPNRPRIRAWLDPFDRSGISGRPSGADIARGSAL